MLIQIDTEAFGRELRLLLSTRKARGMVAALLLGAPLLVYAAVTKPYTFTDGSVISAAQVNANFDALYTAANSPLTGRTWNATQTAALTVTGLNWANVPGLSTSITLPAAATVDLEADGSVTGIAGSGYSGGHCGFRFVVDGSPYGNSSWGDRLIGCPASSNSLGAWWCNWSMRRTLNLSAGTHAVLVQMTGWGGTAAGCASDGGEYSVGKLWAVAR